MGKENAEAVALSPRAVTSAFSDLGLHRTAAVIDRRHSAAATFWL